MGIDPKLDRAWTRASFKHDPIMSWAEACREELVHAALVLVRAWLAAGRPLSRERLGSFEHWAAVMGGVLKVAGVEGFLGNLDELYANPAEPARPGPAGRDLDRVFVDDDDRDEIDRWR